MNSITNVSWFCTNCNKPTNSIYGVGSEMLCDDCYRKRFDKTFDPYNREDMKTLIKESIKEYFDER